jgi:hypothetical protein
VSKLNYLLTALVLLAVGYVVIGQLNRAGGTTYDLLADEVIETIRLNIRDAYARLKRYPDSADEFKTLVLDLLEPHRYGGKVKLSNFKPGNTVNPASFTLTAGGHDREVKVALYYYGSEYRNHLSYKGKLVCEKKR